MYHFRENPFTLWGGSMIELPDSVPNKLTAQDYVYFEFPKGVIGNVFIESNDTSTTHWKTIGPIKKAIRLPAVRFSPTARLMIQGSYKGITLYYVGNLVRASTYIIAPPNIYRRGMI